MRHITCSLKPSFAHENCLIFAGIGSGLHCYQFFYFYLCFALIFIHRCFGSLFWLLGVLIGSLFHKKIGPYLKAWGSLLVLETVLYYFFHKCSFAWRSTLVHMLRSTLIRGEREFPFPSIPKNESL